MIKITKKDMINNLEKYMENNKNKPKKEQAEAYKNLDKLCQEYNLTAEEVLKQIIEDNKQWTYK